jgi:hypothetical protein
VLLSGETVKQIVARVPMTVRRRGLPADKLFHDLKGRSEEVHSAVDIDLLKNLSEPDVAFLTMMFQRRHVYEHNGGEVDERYLEKSGDTSVRLKRVIRETLENVHRLANLLLRCGRNLHDGAPRRRPMKVRTRASLGACSKISDPEFPADVLRRGLHSHAGARAGRLLKPGAQHVCAD